MLITKQRIKEIDVGGNGIDILRKIEKIGRVCYNSEDKITDTSYVNFIENLIKRKHLSVLEHHSITFTWVVSRALANELVRHRNSAFSQQSTRYINYNNKPLSFILPIEFYNDKSSISYMAWLNSITQSEAAYYAMIKDGSSPQLAREVLPLCTSTEIVSTMNLRQLRYMLKLRTAPGVLPQFIDIAKSTINELRVRIPIIFNNLES
jgi:thymidylate synthase (FAD)